ncbi:restriction endonuclease subunit S [Pseudomonas sediminis]|uniref:restriction endonuclease subunit S n=1 Tax=Pseudomonas sediminis TaxID=1691904 RepID=UPI0031CC3F53
MSFSTYPAYKDSGVQWIGNVPEHWDVVRLRNIFLIQKRIAGKLGFDVLSITNKGVKVKDIESGDGQLSSDYSKYQLVMKGEFAMNHMDLVTGYVDISAFDGVTSPDYRVFSAAHPELDSPRFMLRLLQNAYHQKLFFPFGQGSAHLGRWRLPAEEFKDFFFPRPSRSEQTKIALFLDHETARIDALIEEQQRLIELLKEKRQAVISHAVTKGLDPTVPMKDSGVEWLGEVPAHWNVGTLRWYATIQGGVAKGKDYEGRETVVMPYLRVANVQNGYVDLAEVKEIAVLESEVERYRLRAGDVLMNEGGDNDKLGRGTVWQAQIDPCLHQNHVFAIRPNGLLRAEWLAAFTQAEQARTYFYLNSKQSTNLASISASNVMSLALPIPSEKEQLEILTYLEADRIRHEELTAVAVLTVELLQERRSALISAAVTGKIDVRGWQPPVSTQAPEFEVAEAV